MQNKEDSYFEFNDASNQRWFDGVSSFFKKEKFIFLKPLFKKLPQKESIYWLIFFFVAFCITGIILNFIDSYAQDMDTYQNSLTSVGQYNFLMEKEGTAVE